MIKDWEEVPDQLESDMPYGIIVQKSEQARGYLTESSTWHAKITIHSI